MTTIFIVPAASFSGGWQMRIALAKSWEGISSSWTNRPATSTLKPATG